MSGRRYDVAIVGGGSAGIAAAIAAAECGARCILLEREATLGGNISQALVHTICGLYFADEPTPRFANPGFPQRFAKTLLACGAARDPIRAGRVWVLPTDPPKLAQVAVELCRTTAGLEVGLGAELLGATLSSEPGGEQQLVVRAKDGAQEAISARIVVDTSGDAAVAALAGAATETAAPDALQLPSYIFRLADVDTAVLDELQGFGRLHVTRAVAGAVRAGDLSPGCESVLVRPGFEPGLVYVTLNVPRPAEGWKPLDSGCVDDLQAEVRRSADELVAFLRATRPAFARSRIDARPARLGIREGRRLSGRAGVSRDDVCSGRRGADDVAISSWPLELWRDHRRATFVHADGPCGVPLGALQSCTHPGLAAAGRCLAAEADALGALRVIGTALATGEAAGILAARAADAGSDLASVAAGEVRQHILLRAASQPGNPAGPPEGDR